MVSLALWWELEERKVWMMSALSMSVEESALPKEVFVSVLVAEGE